jgi:hypothetical protein
MSEPNFAWLTRLPKDSFACFVHEANGLAADKTVDDWPASIAARRTLTTLRFLSNSEQGKSPDAAGNKGFHYHFLGMESGKRAWNCELSSIDSPPCPAALRNRDAPGTALEPGGNFQLLCPSCAALSRSRLMLACSTIRRA